MDRRSGVTIGAIVLFLLAAGGAVALIASTGGVEHAVAPITVPRGTGATSTATSTPTASAGPATVTCQWKPSVSASNGPTGMDSPIQPDRIVPARGKRVMTLETNRGTITIEIDLALTPCTGASLAFLASQHYYDNTTCHRLLADGYALQCGDPTGTNDGGPAYVFADENLPTGKLPAYHAGDVAMANAGPNTNGGQFSFIYQTSPIEPRWPLFGHVTQGLDIVQAIAAGGDDGFYKDAGGGHPKLPLTFTKVTVH
jgi:peptidyl-prolyl cis-trans isomerase B (cyclophilin B)